MSEETNKKIPLLAGRLQQLIDKTGVNKSGLARICGVTPQSVGKWFRTGSISKESAMKLSETFGVSLSWLLGDDGGGGEVVFDDDFKPVTLTEQQELLLMLFERLPDNAKAIHIATLKSKVEKYDNLFKQLLKSRNIEEIMEAKKNA